MCGILGIVAAAGRNPSLDDSAVVRLRDLMTHRGPDGAGLWRCRNAVLAHRRLKVVDLTPAGDQPMVSDDGQSALVYNGELYNDAELRDAILKCDGRPFRSQCDTETVLRALELWGAGALARFRGMFALAYFDAETNQLTLARDPLGIKPLYYTVVNGEVVFASELKPILAHPAVSPAPNIAMVSAYLTTIRTVIGADTLFDGVLAVEPGQAIHFDLSDTTLSAETATTWCSSPVAGKPCADHQRSVERCIDDAVRVHLRSDAPLCALLSGGLDSTITTCIARDHVFDLRTYCAGAPNDGDDDDLSCARIVAAEFGVQHNEALISRSMFAHRWPEMVREMGTPLSTPNEVAINAVARRLRQDGCVVTISGEGADELFAGYDAPMLAAWRYSRLENAAETGGRFQLETNSWVPVRAKTALLREGVFDAAGRDEPLMNMYDDIFKTCVEEAGFAADPVDAHLRFLRKVNLVGLLQRLDTATMLASVEGRTPFADVRVAELAESLPIEIKFDAGGLGADEFIGGVTTSTRVQTKIALRRAFAGRIPSVALDRPKASFPLPFQEWVVDGAGALRKSEFARSILSDDTIEMVAMDPCKHWQFAWPMMNLAMWGDNWWGEPGSRH